MSDVPSNLIPTRITQLPIAPVASEDSLMMIVYQGNNYQIRVGDLLSVAGVPTSRQVIAGTSLTGGGALSSNVTLSVAVGGIGNTQLAATGVSAGTYGDATNIPVFTVDEKGRIQAATTVPATISGYVPVTREIIAGTGLNGGGALNANVTLNANLSDATPLETDGLGAPGVSTDMARADHQHPSINLGVSSEVDGVLSVANGGTSRSIVPDAGAIIWSGADGLYVGPVGAAGQVMQSNGTGEYIWVDQSTLDVGQADNLNGGAANKIPYQSATDVTAFIDAPTDAETLLKWNGTGFEWGTVAGAGTVTSVGLALPSDFNVTNTPVTGAGTLTGAWANQTTNKVLAAPNGSTGTPSFRALANADLPDSGVSANTYGSTTAIPVITVNAKGVVTGVTTATITGGLVYQGSWNALTNTPTLASGVGTNGYYYIVSVAGTTNLDGITDWQVGDWAIFNGTAWQKIDQTNLVSSVNSQTGAVVLTASDVGAQPADAQLTDIAGLTPSDNNFIVGNGTNFVTESGSTARTSLGLGSIATQAASSVAITGGAIDGTTLGSTTRAAVAGTTELIGPAASANFTRFPNALSVVSNTDVSIQQNETEYIGLIAEATANSATPSTRAAGLYGVGYTQGGGSGEGVNGEGHVSASSDTGNAVGVRGYANDTHSGGLNIGLYGNASGSSVGNYALYLKNGDVLSYTALNWSLGGNLTFTGAYKLTVPAIDVTGAIGFGSSPSYGTSGQVLTSAGTGAAPTWTTISGGVSITDDTTTNATRYPLFTSATTGNITTEYTSSTKFAFNPSTGALTTTRLTPTNA